MMIMEAKPCKISTSFSESLRNETLLGLIINHRHSSSAIVDSDAQSLDFVPLSSTSGRAEQCFRTRKWRKGCNANHLQPVGVLYNVTHFKEVNTFSGHDEGTIHEETIIGDKHTVSTYFRQGNLLDEKLVSLSTSHKYNGRDVLAMHYSDDLKGGGVFNMNILHTFRSNLTLSTSFHGGSFCDPMLEVEFNKGKDLRKVWKRLQANLKTGEKQINLGTENVVRGIFSKQTFTTNAKDQHSLSSETNIPISSSSHILQSFATDFKERKESSMNLSKSIRKHNLIGASFSTNMGRNNYISMEAKHEVQSHRDASLKLTNDFQGGKQLNISLSTLKGPNRFACNFRKDGDIGQSLDLEWRHEYSSDHNISIRASVQGLMWNMFAELCLPL